MNPFEIGLMAVFWLAGIVLGSLSYHRMSKGDQSEFSGAICVVAFICILIASFTTWDLAQEWDKINHPVPITVTK